MGGLFGGSSMPAPAPIPVAPTQQNSAAATSAAALQDQLNRQAAGRSSTVLTGSSGLGDLGQTTSTSNLLGGK